MQLTDTELAAHDPLARSFIRHLRALVPASAFKEERVDSANADTILVVRVPARAASVGDLLVYSDGAELTTMVGDHTHGHTGAYLFGDPTDPTAIDRAASSEAKWIQEMLDDHIVVWSRRGANRRVLAGGTERVAPAERGNRPSWSRIATEAWLWSGVAVTF